MAFGMKQVYQYTIHFFKNSSVTRCCLLTLLCMVLNRVYRFIYIYYSRGNLFIFILGQACCTQIPPQPLHSVVPALHSPRKYHPIVYSKFVIIYRDPCGNDGVILLLLTGR